MKLHVLKPWRTWDDGQKRNAIRITGVCIAIFALFTLVSTVSYIFTWKQDQSLLRDPEMMDLATNVANAGGKLGLKWANVLVCKWFGLGSFAFLVLLFAMAVRLVAGKWHHSLLKTATVTFSGAVIVSFILALLGRYIGIPTMFGAGIGGECGSFVVDRMDNAVGPVITAVVLLALLILWLFLSSERFSEWFKSLGKTGEVIRDEEQDIDDIQPEITAVPAAPSVMEAKVEERIAEPVRPAPVFRREQPDPAPVPEENPVTDAEEEPGEGGSFEIERGEELDTEIKKQLPRIDVRLDPPEGLPNYKFPSLDILEDHSSDAQIVSDEELNRNNNKIRSTLKNYKIDIVDVKAVVGPTVTLYKVYPAPGVKIANIRSLQDDIAMSLNARGVRIVTLPDSVGIEVANDRPSTVPLKGLLNDDAFRNSKAELPVAIGCTITKKVKVFDLADAPHLLVAGATKQGKSVGLNVLVASLLYAKHPSEMKMVFIDPKMVEFSAYGRMLKHYLAVLPTAGDEDEERENAIVKKPKEAEKILRSLCVEMDDRYELLSKAYVNNIKLYNERYKDRKLNPENGHRFLPYLVVIIDEYADLAMSGGSGSEAKNMQKSIMGSIVRLAQKGRAAGIHVVIATQRPSVDVITGLIKANFPARIAFRVSTRVDSNTILDATGAEKLIGRGDMLYYAGVETERIQCGFISNDEINAITEFIGEQQGYKKSYNTPYYLPAPEPAEEEGGGGGMIDMKDLDERFEEAARMVVMTQKGSTSDIQRRLGMGYAKAGRVMDQLEAAGIVGPQEGSKPRQVLVSDFNELDTILKAYLK